MESRTGITGGKNKVRVEHYRHRRVESGLCGTSCPFWKIVFDKTLMGHRVKPVIIPTDS
jgi:hypothetical protein